MTGRTVLITGATGGIGRETATALAKRGATVVVTGRDPTRGEQAVKEIREVSSNANVHLLVADLLLQREVKVLAGAFKERFDRLDVLINNVGGLFEQRFETEDGVEATFAVNVLTPFLLTHLLLDVLKTSRPARVINLTGGIPGTRLDTNNLQAQRSFVGLQTYSHAKLAMSALSYELAERLKRTGVSLNVTYPGAADTSMTQALSRDMLPPLMRLALPLIKLASRSAPENAAQSSIYLASSPEVEGVTATYFNTKSKRTAWSKAVLDAEKRRAVWERAVQLTGLDEMSDALLSLEHLGKSFVQRGRRVNAVEDINLDILPGEVLSLVGESGSGKTTVGRMMAGLLTPSTGRILYSGADISRLRGAERRAYRLGVQLIHQDPYASLNPTQRVREILAAPLKRHRLVRGRDELEVRLRKLLREVDLTPEETIGKFPHQLSGGQRQRLSIARALSVSPSFLVADEAVSMVDVSIRISILQTLKRLRDEHGLAILFITHDLALAKHFASNGRVGVMYLGRIVEIADADDLVRNPQHPYTQALLAASPPDPLSTKPRPEPVKLRYDDAPSLIERPSGCPFSPRCPHFTQGVCDVAVPPLVATSPRHATACALLTAAQPGVRKAAVGPPQGVSIPP